MAKYRVVYMDGGNGWKLGEVVEGRIEDGVLLVDDPDDEDSLLELDSRNEDGLFQNEEEDCLYVPMGED